jgi:tetraacyldisaccharide 4'-kinase
MHDVVLTVDQPERHFGDEPCMYVRELGLPVTVANSRVEAVERLVARGVSLVLADDAFQHLALARDVDLVLLDATASDSHWRGLPSGRMREPWSALSRANFVLITKVDQAGEERAELLKRRAADWVPAERIQIWEQELVLSKSADEVVLVSGIARPELFEKMMRAQGLTIRRHFQFKDHHSYSSTQIEEIRKFSLASRVQRVVTTTKDYYKLLPALGDLGLVAAQIQAVPRLSTSLQDLDRYVFGA